MYIYIYIYVEVLWMLGKEGSLQPTCYHFFESKTPLQAVVSRACKNHGVSRSRAAWREVAVYTPFLRAKIKGKHRKRQTETITLAQKDGTHRNTSEHIGTHPLLEQSRIVTGRVSPKEWTMGTCLDCSRRADAE